MLEGVNEGGTLQSGCHGLDAFPGPPLVPQRPGSCTKACLPQLPASLSPHCETSSHPGPKSRGLPHQIGPFLPLSHSPQPSMWPFFQHPTHTPSHMHTHTDTKKNTCSRILLTHICSHTCIYMHMPTHTYTLIFTHTHTLTHTDTHRPKSIPIYTCSYIPTHHSHTCVHMDTQTCSPTYTCAHLHTHTLTYRQRHKEHTYIHMFLYACS